MLTWLLLQNSVGEESHLAIETSGHGALKENHWLDDGAYLMVIILCFRSKICVFFLSHVD